MASDQNTKDWQVPYAAAEEKDKLGWLNESVEESQHWLKDQRGYSDFRKAFDIISGRVDARDIPSYRSQLNTNRLKRNIREIIGACANIRPIWGFNSDNPDFAAQCNMMNKATRAIYLERFLDRGIKSTLQWAASTNTGWLRPVYRRSMYGSGKGNLTFLSYGSPSILPVQLPSNNDWQEAYAINILDELPIAMAHGMFPEFQEKLRPTSSRYWYASEIRQAAKGNLVQRMWNKWTKGSGAALSDLYIPIRYTYIIDLTINKTDQMIPMGEPNTSWYYEVPNLGSDIPVGKRKDGTVIYRKANINDARLYPYRRLMISSENCVMYDGPAFDWHGEFPCVPFCLDDWAWEAIGFSLVHDGYQIQQSINLLERGVMDKHIAALDPPLAYDINAVGRNEALGFDPMQPRMRVGFDNSMTERPFQDVLPESYRQVDPQTPVFIQHLGDTMDYQQAIRDVVALAKARAMGGGVNDYEKLIEADGPIVADITRNMEYSLSIVGNQCKYHILQYHDVKRIMEYVGEDGITRETFDYDPNSMIPSHMADENGSEPSIYSKVQRARNFAGNLRFYLTPHSAHEITQMAHKLLLIQLRKAGIQIDSRTVAESCDIANFGPEPKGNTVWERYWNEQEMVAQHAIRVKKLVDSIVQEGVSPTPAMQGALGEQPGVPPREGRPTSGQESPVLVQKDGGQRSTISESGT